MAAAVQLRREVRRWWSGVTIIRLLGHGARDVFQVANNSVYMAAYWRAYRYIRRHNKISPSKARRLASKQAREWYNYMNQYIEEKWLSQITRAKTK